MSREEDAIFEETRTFLSEMSAGIPIHNLLRTGAFPDRWNERYLHFVSRISAHYGESSPLPRDVLAVIYNASVYCTKRYFDWQRFTNGVNEETEQQINEMRWAGDQLILGRFWREQRNSEPG